MGVVAMRLFGLLLLFAGTAASAAPPGSVTLDHASLDRLAALRSGGELVMPAFPVGPGVLAPIRFERIEVYAPTAKIIEVGVHGERELPRSRRVELIGSGTDSDVRLGLSFGPAFTKMRGSGSGPSGLFAIRAERVATGLRLHAIAANEALPQGVTPDIQSRDDAPAGGQPMPGAAGLALAGLAAPSGGPPSIALVAIDTDNEFMSERFGNDAVAAADWIADLFGVMNVMYQRDLAVRLAQGTTFLRTAPDPYNASDTPADQTDLDEFGNYWQAHYAGVPRSFAALLSGKSSSGNSASGIAWLNAYCRTQSNGGSYSVNQIFTNPGIPVDLSARISGHELGHNFGAWHTHCTEATTGVAPTGINTIDRCYNGEAAQGCYSGSTSCPATGPGHPLGTIMSYCNLNGCGQDVLQFHPTQVTTLSVLIGINTPTCLMRDGDAIFANGFD